MRCSQIGVEFLVSPSPYSRYSHILIICKTSSTYSSSRYSHSRDCFIPYSSHIPPHIYQCSINPSLTHSPQQNPPPPPLENLEILLIDIRIPPLDPRRQPPQPLLHRLGHPQRHLVLEDEEHGEHEEGDLGEAPVAEQPFLDVRDEALGLLEGVLGVVGGLLGLLVRAAAEDAADEGDERCAALGLVDELC
jgi:hypothetical protein